MSVAAGIEPTMACFVNFSIPKERYRHTILLPGPATRSEPVVAQRKWPFQIRHLTMVGGWRGEQIRILQV